MPSLSLCLVESYLEIFRYWRQYLILRTSWSHWWCYPDSPVDQSSHYTFSYHNNLPLNCINFQYDICTQKKCFMLPSRGHMKQNQGYVSHGTEWSARRTRNPAVPGSSPALATCWICARSSRVQILGHACKQPTGRLLPVGVFNPVMLYLNYLFLNI